jgi:WXG100 family type VII secretion target
MGLNKYDSGSMDKAAGTMSEQLSAIKRDLGELDDKLDELWLHWDAESRRDMQKTVEEWGREQQELTVELTKMEALMGDSSSTVTSTEAENTNIASSSGSTGNAYRARL